MAIMNAWFIILALAAYFYWTLRRIYTYFDKRGTPYAKPTYLLGSNPKGALMLQHFSEHGEAIYNMLKPNKIGGFFQYTTPMYMVLDPDYVQKVFVSDFSSFTDRGIDIDPETNPLEGNLALLAGNQWRYVRSKLNPIFNLINIKLMFDDMQKCCDTLMSRIDNMADGMDRDFKQDFVNFTIDSVGVCTMGVEPHVMNNPNSILRKISRLVFNIPFIYFVKIACRLFFPRLALSLKLKTVPKHVDDFFCKKFIETIDSRVKSETQRKDMFQLLLKNKQKSTAVDEECNAMEYEVQSIHDGPFKPSELAAHCFAFFAAGFEATSTTIQYIMFLLARHPDIQRKAREEVTREINEHGGLNYESLNKMVYLGKCISETLRLYPQFYHIFRQCSKRYTFPNGVVVDKGRIVVLPIIALHRDPKYYPDPDVFRPERFDTPPKPGTYAPFGDGPRNCIGKRFALTEMKLAISRILENYTIESSDKTKTPIKINAANFTMSPTSGIYVRLRKLNNSQHS